MTLVMGAMSFRFTGQLNLRDGPLATLVPAMAFVVAGLLLLARTPVDATYAVDLLPAMILIGLGAGLGFPSLMTLAMSGATASDSGLASGLVNTSVQVGGAIGLAVLATLATERTDGLLADGESAASALNSGYHLACVIGAGLVIVAIATAVSVLRSRLPEGAAEPAAEPVAEPVAQGVEAPRIRVRPCWRMSAPGAAAWRPAPGSPSGAAAAPAR
jgi:MFS family permease